MFIKFKLLSISVFFLLLLSSCSINTNNEVPKQEALDSFVYVDGGGKELKNGKGYYKILKSEYLVIQKIREAFCFQPLEYYGSEASYLIIQEVDSSGHILNLELGRNEIIAFEKHLKSFPKIETLQLSNIDITDIKSLNGVSDRLKSLSIYKEQLSHEFTLSADFSEHWGELKKLFIHHVGIKSIKFPKGGNLKNIFCYLGPEVKQLDENFFANKQLEKLSLLYAPNLEPFDLSIFPKLKKDRTSVPWSRD